MSLTEAAEILGFATAEKGAIDPTSLGETFAEASILARKEIFATRIRRLSLVRWLTTMLTHSENHALDWDVIQTALELEFPTGEAENSSIPGSIGDVMLSCFPTMMTKPWFILRRQLSHLPKLPEGVSPV